MAEKSTLNWQSQDLKKRPLKGRREHQGEVASVVVVVPEVAVVELSEVEAVEVSAEAEEATAEEVLSVVEEVDEVLSEVDAVEQLEHPSL